MPDYRRVYTPGATYFFTVVTHNRRPLFQAPETRRWLRSAIQETRRKHPFRLDAICLLPDHVHCLWTMPADDGDFSRRWQSIKASFSWQALHRGRLRRDARPSKKRRREVEIWQRRFWEHQIRNQEDLRRHLDYIHFNPVKHGLARRPIDWRWSSFRRYVRLGWYDADWGTLEPSTIEDLSAE